MAFYHFKQNVMSIAAAAAAAVALGMGYFLFSDAVFLIMLHNY